MHNRFCRAAGLVLVSVAIAACAPLPKLTPLARLPVADTIKHLNCEMKLAFYGDSNRPPKLPTWFVPDQWSASVELTMQADSAVDAGVGYTRVRKSSDTRTYTLGLGAGLDQKGHRDSFLSYSGDLSKLQSLHCSVPVRVKSFGFHPLTGNLGIADWSQSLANDYDEFTEPNTLRYAARFTLDVSASADPVLVISDITKGFSGLVEQKNEDTLSIALVKKVPPPPATDPIAVYIVEKGSNSDPKSAKRDSAVTVKVVPRRTPRQTDGGVDVFTQQRLDAVQGQGAVVRSLPNCRISGFC